MMDSKFVKHSIAKQKFVNFKYHYSHQQQQNQLASGQLHRNDQPVYQREQANFCDHCTNLVLLRIINQRLAASILITTNANSFTTLGAVSPRPSLSNAIRVAFLTIWDAKGRPYSSFQKLHTEIAPDSISPSPPDLLSPPCVLTIKDLFRVRIRSSLPFITNEKSANF